MKEYTSIRRMFFVVAETAAYWCAFYFIQLINLLHFDGAAPVWLYGVVAALCCGAVFALSTAHFRFDSKKDFLAPAIEALLFAVFALAPLLALERADPSKGFSIFWMPGEWIKLPSAIFFGARVSFPFFAAYSALLLAALLLWMKKGISLAAYLLLLPPFIVAARCAPLLDSDNRGIMYLAAMVAPPAAAALFVSRKSVRSAFRAAFLTLVVMAALPFYFGIVPFFPKDDPAAGKLVCKLTPGCSMTIPDTRDAPFSGAARVFSETGPANNRALSAFLLKTFATAPSNPTFPLPFMRKFYSEPPFLFTTYGPTCGFVRFNGFDSPPDVMKYRSLIRYIWSEPGIPYLVGPDWINSNLVFIDKKNFVISKTVDLLQYGLAVPMDLDADEHYAYLLSTEPPAIARFRKSDFAFVDMLDFKKLGLIKFSHGAYAFAIDKTNRAAYVQLGALDVKKTFRIVKIDLKTFTVAATKDIRTGSVLMTSIPEKNALLVYDYYWRNVHELDASTLETRRVFSGPVNCRAAIYDGARDLIYMAGSGLGEFSIIDYKTGKNVANYFIGNRAGPMAITPDRKTLLLGSGYGVFSVDLEKLNGMTR